MNVDLYKGEIQRILFIRDKYLMKSEVLQTERLKDDIQQDDSKGRQETWERDVGICDMKVDIGHF